VELGIIHDTATGMQCAKQLTHLEVVSSPVSDLTIEHTLDRQYVRVQLVTADHFLLAATRIDECEFGEHSPVVTNRYFVHLRFTAPFAGTVRLDY
jgi:hypothetical protein